MRERIPTTFVLALGVGVGLFSLTNSGGADKPSESAATNKRGTVVLTAALVDQEMQVRPVPLYSLVLASSLGDSVTVRTDLSGKASITLSPGSYTLSSFTPALFQGNRYRWLLKKRDRLVCIVLSRIWRD